MEDNQNEPIKKKTGPKKKEDTKEREYFYLKKSTIKKKGGWDKIKKIFYKLMGEE